MTISAGSTVTLSQVALTSVTAVDSWNTLQSQIQTPSYGESTNTVSAAGLGRPEIFYLIDDGTAGAWEINAKITIAASGTPRNITLKTSGSPVVITRTAGFTDNFFDVPTNANLSLYASSGAKLELKGISSTGSGTGDGGGVYVAGSFEMGSAIGAATPTEISGNTAGNRGGGVSVSRGEFNMYDGSLISGNTAIEGGGVYIFAGNIITFDKETNAEISGNTTAALSGSGKNIAVVSSSPLEYRDGDVFDTHIRVEMAAGGGITFIDPPISPPPVFWND